MLYINKGVENTLVLNINNNSDQDFTGYTLSFTHIMSNEKKEYLIDKSNSEQYWQNIRYCNITLDLQTDDLNYEGEYQLKIYGNGTDLIFTGIAILEGTVEQPLFTTYISPNEENNNYIYIQE